jgi:hypothetical protein
MRQFRRDLPGGLDAIQPRHGHIHDNYIGRMLLGERHGLASVRGIRDHLKIRLTFEQQAEAFPHDRVIVGE